MCRPPRVSPFVMSSRIFARGPCLIALVLAWSGCGARPEHVDVVPIYRLSVTPTAVSWLRAGQTLSLTLQDTRAGQPGVIGENTEESVAVPVRESSPGASARLVQSALTKELRDLGAQFVSAEAADRRIRVTLIKLWVQEGNTYSGEIRTRVSVLDKAGTVLADVLAVGTSTRFGRSLSAENYQETIENMLQDMMENLFADAAFQQAFAKLDTPSSVDTPNRADTPNP